MLSLSLLLENGRDDDANERYRPFPNALRVTRRSSHPAVRVLIFAIGPFDEAIYRQTCYEFKSSEGNYA